VGEDNFSEVVLSALQKKKVDTSHVIKSNIYSTGATIVLNYDQDRAMVTYPGAMNELCLEDITIETLSAARHMHFSSCFLQPGIRPDLVALFRLAKELGLTTSFDAQWDPEEKWDIPLDYLLPWVDVFLPNIQEFKFLTKCSTVEEGIGKLRDCAKTIIIKNGSEGAIAWDGTSLVTQPAFKNDTIVDCIGAGDSFNAGFIWEFINKKPLKKCLETAALTGALNTTRAGGTGAFENFEMIREIAWEKFKYQI
jgi:sugar/nucleoside kinase (ribokinase family)